VRREVSPVVVVVVLIVVIAIVLLAWYLFLGPKGVGEAPTLQQSVSPDAAGDEESLGGGPSADEGVGGMEPPAEPYVGEDTAPMGTPAPADAEDELMPPG